MTALDTANAIVRTWTSLYTARLPDTTRDDRRAEIESDLWELAHDVDDPDALAPAVLVLARLVRGVPDDLQWRASFVTIGSGSVRAAITIGTAAIALLAAWVYAVATPTVLPNPAPLVKVVDVFPPPPPPPPPPPGVIRRESWTIVIHQAPPPSR
jgi:hypothetical protein